MELSKPTDQTELIWRKVPVQTLHMLYTNAQVLLRTPRTVMFKQFCVLVDIYMKQKRQGSALQAPSAIV